MLKSQMEKHVKEWWQRAGEMARVAAEEPDGYTKLVDKMASGDFMPGWALIAAGKPAIPALVEGLKHSHTRVRRACVDTIDHGGYGGDAQCIAALLPLLHDPAPRIRRVVWHTLFCDRCPDEERCEVRPTEELDRVAYLIDIGLNDPNPKLRRQLVAELGNFVADSRARTALEKLKRRESDPELRAAAQLALRGNAREDKSLTIRPAESGNAAELAELARLTYSVAFGHSFSEADLAAHLETHLSTERFAQIIENDVVLLIIVRGRIVGYVQFGEAGADSAREGDQELRRLYVHPDFQNQGYGAALMKSALRHPTMKNAPTIFLDVWEKNPGAQRFYQRFGFEATGVRSFEVASGAETSLDVIMARRCTGKSVQEGPDAR